MKKALLFTALIIFTAGLTVSAEEKQTNRPGGTIVEVSTITATVEAIDYKTRMVTLKGPEGNMVTVKVGEEAKNFNQVAKGDKVTFDYYAALAIDVQKSKGEPQSVQTQKITRSEPGDKPGGTIESTAYITAKVEKIDYKSRMVTLRGPEGNIMTFKAGDQVKRLNAVGVSDEVVVQYVLAVVISVKK
jgi:Cu/Ag efflux protein CusF